jgi:hypothetical protein
MPNGLTAIAAAVSAVFLVNDLLEIFVIILTVSCLLFSKELDTFRTTYYFIKSNSFKFTLKPFIIKIYPKGFS